MLSEQPTNTDIRPTETIEMSKRKKRKATRRKRCESPRVPINVRESDTACSKEPMKSSETPAAVVDPPVVSIERGGEGGATLAERLPSKSPCVMNGDTQQCPPTGKKNKWERRARKRRRALANLMPSATSSPPPANIENENEVSDTKEAIPSVTVARCESTIPTDTTPIVPDIDSDIEAAFVRKVLELFRKYRKDPTHSTTNLFAALEAAEKREEHQITLAEPKAGHELVAPPDATECESENSSTPPATILDLAVPEGLYSDKEEPMSPVRDRPALLPSRDYRVWREHLPTQDVWREQVNMAYTSTADRYLGDLTESTAEVQSSDWSDGTSSPLLAAVDPRCGLAHLDWKEEESDNTYGSAGFWSRQLSPDSPLTVSDKSGTPELDFGPSSLPPSSAIHTPRTPRTVRGRLDSSSTARFRRQEKHARASISPLKQKTRTNVSMLADTPEPDEGTLSRRPNDNFAADTSPSEATGSQSGDFVHFDSWSHLATSTSPGYRARTPTWRTYQGIDEQVESDEGSVLFSSDEQDEVDELDDEDEDEKIHIAGTPEVVIPGDEDTLIFALETDSGIPPLRTLGDPNLSNGPGAANTSLLPIRWFSRDGGDLALLERIRDATANNPRIMGASSFLGNPKRTHGIDGPVRETAHGMVYRRKVLKIPPTCTEVDARSCHDDSHFGDEVDADSVDELLSEDEDGDAIELGESDISLRDTERFKSEIGILGRDFATRMIAHASHASNLACADPEARARAKLSIVCELRKARSLGYATLVVHPGSYDVGKEGSRNGLSDQDLAARSRRTLVSDIRDILQEVEDIKLAFENMPCRCRGQIGTTLADLKSLIDEVDEPRGRLQVCVDLNHVYTAQVDFTTTAGLEKLIAAINDVGTHNIAAFHLSDSGYQHGSAGDAHVDFGRGYIGIDAYRRLLRHPIFSQVPTIFEAPPYCTTFRHTTLKGTTIPENLRRLDDLNQELFELIIRLSDQSWAEYGKCVIKHYYFVEIRIRQRIRQAAMKLGDAAYQAFQQERQETSDRNRAIARGKETGGVRERKVREIGMLSELGIIPKEVRSTPWQTTRGGKKFGVRESRGKDKSDSIGDSGSMDESESDIVLS